MGGTSGYDAIGLENLSTDSLFHQDSLTLLYITEMYSKDDEVGGKSIVLHSYNTLMAQLCPASSAQHQSTDEHALFCSHSKTLMKSFGPSRHTKPISTYTIEMSTAEHQRRHPHTMLDK